jgi:pimeloyl-ACP methyl ester carboxylesterase
MAHENPALDADRWKAKTYVHDGLSFSYIDEGSGSPILFLHGATVSKESWAAQIAHFRASHRVIAPDLRGHGASDAGEAEHTVGMYARDVLSLLDELDIRSAVVCGHSAGGFVAQHLALDHAERVSALVLVDTSYGITTSVWERMMNAFARVYLKSTSGPKLVQAFAESAGKQSEETRKYCYSVMQKYAERKDRFLQIWHAVETFRSKERLAAIGQPTLIVSPDRFAQAAGQAKHMAKTIPNSKRVIVRDAGHMVMMDNSEGFNRELESFLRI